MAEFRVVFQSVRWKNFMGTGNAFTELKLDGQPRALLIGKNGAGKSQFIDAISFVLYNRPFRDVNKPDLINTINNKDCVVELEMTVMGIPYKVIRGQRPAIFEVWKNGIKHENSGVDDLQEYLEKQVVKMNYKTFSQVVVLGSANFIPFMQLPPAIRREVNESLLDLQTFSLMSLLLKGKISALKQEIASLTNEISRLENAVSIYSSQIAKLSEDNEGLIMDLQIKVGECDEQIEKYENEVASREAEQNEIIASLIDLTALEKKRSYMQSLKGSLSQKKSSAHNNLVFFENNEACPVCSQDINPVHKKGMVAKCSHDISEVDENLEKLERLIAANETSIAAAATTQHRLNTLKGEISIRRSNVEMWKLKQKEIEAQIAKLKEPTSALASAQSQFTEALVLLDQSKTILDEKKTIMDHYDVSADMLKDDGIKATIIAKYMPIINAQVNAYLGAMNFFVGFEMNETFDVVFKSRHRDKFKYGMFSEGQKARIDLALMLTWRDVAALKNSISTNLLIMDEVFDGSLDGDGVTELMQIFDALADQNIWVVSHKDLMIEKFDKVYRFVLESNFSQMETVE